MCSNFDENVEKEETRDVNIDRKSVMRAEAIKISQGRRT